MCSAGYRTLVGLVAYRLLLAFASCCGHECAVVAVELVIISHDRAASLCLSGRRFIADHCYLRHARRARTAACRARAGAEPQELRALMSQMEMGEVAVAGHAVALAFWHAVRPTFAPVRNPWSSSVQRHGAGHATSAWFL